MERIIIDF